MTQVLSDRFCVGLRWEPLLGLEREAKEIRTLLARRDVSRYAVYAGEMGTRSLGLVPDLAGAESSQTMHSFLCLVGAAVKQKSFLFVHPHPEDPAKVVIVGVRDDRPELDDIYEAAEASAAIGRFLADDALSDMTVAGVSTPAAPHVVINKALPLSDLLTGATERDLKRAVVTALKSPMSFRVKRLPAALFAGAVIAAAVTAWWATSEDEAIEMPVYDVAQSFQGRLNQALLAETADGGAHFAQALELAVRAIPVDVYGWRAMTIDCDEKFCTVDRRRQIGADATAMLDALDNVKLKGLEEAIETVNVTTPRPDVSDVKPVSQAAFSATTAARMQQLGDYGLSPSLDPASPIIPVPSALSAAASVNIVKRGAWSLSGDLAFLDSMTGLMVQSGNMVLKSLRIDVGTDHPSFTAKGYYYVE